MRIEKDQRRALGAIVVLVVLYVAVHGLPSSKHRAALRTQIDELRAQTQRERSGVTDLADLGRHVIALEERVAQDEKYLPHEAERPKILTYLSSHLERYSVLDQEIRTRPTVAGAQYNVTPVSVRFVGSFLAVYRFMQDVERMPQLARVTRFELRGAPSTDEARLLSVRIDLDTFFLPPTAEQDREARP